jgi:phage-related protein
VSWNILFFETKRGEKIVKKFIKSQSEPTIAKILHKIDLLQNYGPNLGMPHTKKITDRLYELRIRGTDEIRIFYTFLNNKIFLLHGFKKKTQEIPAKEIAIAESRLKDWKSSVTYETHWGKR